MLTTGSFRKRFKRAQMADMGRIVLKNSAGTFGGKY
tara:strand:+ start:1834 stop:1941 length:108 start_codon:yes stop_codon:yes gene_type:complete